VRRRDSSKGSAGHAMKPAFICMACLALLTSGLAASASAVAAPSAHAVRPPHARTSIVGGHEIMIETAPWQVAVVAFDPKEGGGEEVKPCGGVILSDTEILTAAECVYNWAIATPTLLSPEDVFVVAGQGQVTPTEAKTTGARASGVAAHPYYVASKTATSADDVAIVKLETPLSLGANEKTIGMVPEGAILNEGTNVNLSAFGEETNPGAYGHLNSLAMTLAFPRRCGGEDDALFLCASTSSGSVCRGDFGSGLELPGAPNRVAAITDYFPVGGCGNGAIGFFANLAAPEIREWIDGKAAPEHAPRGGHAVIRGVLSVGNTLTCEPGTWLYNPTITILFVDSSGGIILQAGSSQTYQLTSADVGRMIYCEVRASNAGGTAFGRTEALEPIAPASSGSHAVTGPTSTSAAPASAGEPHGTVSLPVNRIQVKGHTAVLKLHCHGGFACIGRLTISARTLGKRKPHARSHSVTLGVSSFQIAGGETKSLKLKLGGPVRDLLNAGHGRLAATLSIVEREATASRVEHKRIELIARPHA